MPSRIASIAASVERARSVSSIRSRNRPPWWRANSQLNSAVRAPPIWRKPVGEGAKRVTIWPVARPVSLAISLCFLSNDLMAISETPRVPMGDVPAFDDVAVQRNWRSLRHLSSIAVRIDRMLGEAAFDRGPWTVIVFAAGIASWFLLRSEEHTSELQSLMRTPYAVFCLEKKNTQI